MICPHNIHIDNACGACVPPRGSTIRGSMFGGSIPATAPAGDSLTPSTRRDCLGQIFADVGRFDGTAPTGPVAWLRPITHPDWLEVCDRDAPGAFAVCAGDTDPLWWAESADALERAQLEFGRLAEICRLHSYPSTRDACLTHAHALRRIGGHLAKLGAPRSQTSETAIPRAKAGSNTSGVKAAEPASTPEENAMRSDAEIDRDHEGMKDNCQRQAHGCTFPSCGCSRRGAKAVKVEPPIAPPFERWANRISNVICEMPDQFAFQRGLITELQAIKDELRAHVSGVGGRS